MCETNLLKNSSVEKFMDSNAWIPHTFQFKYYMEQNNTSPFCSRLKFTQYLLSQGLKSLGPVFAVSHVVITLTRRSKSFDISARRIFESAPRVVLTSLATLSHGVPADRVANNSPPRFTASAIAGGTSGTACTRSYTNHGLEFVNRFLLSGEGNCSGKSEKLIVTT